MTMRQFSSRKRKEIFQSIQNERYDVIIIGGGITGAGIALDAVTRGMKALVVEMQDFAAGTSSRSTKLVHGGLRYLKQFEVKLVADVGKERAIVHENGPHVTTPEWMLLPFYKGGTFGPFSTNIGLRIYDFLAGVKKEERRKMLSPQEVLQKVPIIKKESLSGAGFYVEYKTDDARLTIEVLKKAVEHGAHAVNYAQVVEFIYHLSGKMTGVLIEDKINGAKIHVNGKKVVNASGPWVDELCRLDQSQQGKQLYLTKGVHLVFSKEVFPLQQAVYFDTEDGRMVFAIPRDDKTYVGTTDTYYNDNLAEPQVTIADRNYLLDAIAFMFPTLNITAHDVESSWAGLRPLIAEVGKNPSEISRKDEIFIAQSGLISIAGGKLTGYRKMAEHVVNTIVNQFKEEERILYSQSMTQHLPISGGDVGGASNFKQFKEQKIKEGMSYGLSKHIAAKLVQRYGTNIDIIYHMYNECKNEANEYNIDPVVLAELKYTIDYEFVYKPVDFFIRRTGALFFNIDWVRKHENEVIEYMAKTLHWTEIEKTKYRDELDHSLQYAVTPIE